MRGGLTKDFDFGLGFYGANGIKSCLRQGLGLSDGLKLGLGLIST